MQRFDDSAPDDGAASQPRLSSTSCPKSVALVPLGSLAAYLLHPKPFYTRGWTAEFSLRA